MANLIKFKTGLEVNRSSVVFELGEPAFTTDTKEIFVGDGVTPGGNKISYTLPSALSTINSLSPTNGNVIIGNGSTWVVQAGGVATSAQGTLATNAVPKSAFTGLGTLLYGNGASVVGTLAAGSVGQVLKSNGATAPSWLTLGTMSLETATNYILKSSIATSTSLGTSDVLVPSQNAVRVYVNNATSTLLANSDAMIFKGTIGAGGTLTIAAFNALTVYNAGWTYRVIEAGTIKGIVTEIGDLLLATVDRTSGGINTDWTVAQSNTDGVVVGPVSSTDNHIAVFNGTSGKLIKDSGVIPYVHPTTPGYKHIPPGGIPSQVLMWESNGVVTWTEFSGDAVVSATGVISIPVIDGGTFGAPSDTTAPAAPTGLASSLITDTTFTLSWVAPTDNVAVTGYYIYKNDNTQGNWAFWIKSNTTTKAISGLLPGDTNIWYVQARDAAGNVSLLSTSLSVTQTGSPM